MAPVYTYYMWYWMRTCMYMVHEINTRAAFIIFYWCHLYKYMMNVMHSHNATSTSYIGVSVARTRGFNEKTAHRFLFVFGNHIASFIISSVRKLWNEHIWEWFLRIEKSCRASLSCCYCDYEECIMLTFFHSFSCSNVGVCNVHWFFSLFSVLILQSKKLHLWSIANLWLFQSVIILVCSVIVYFRFVVRTKLKKLLLSSALNIQYFLPVLRWMLNISRAAYSYIACRIWIRVQI